METHPPHINQTIWYPSPLPSLTLSKQDMDCWLLVDCFLELFVIIGSVGLFKTIWFFHGLCYCFALQYNIVFELIYYLIWKHLILMYYLLPIPCGKLGTPTSFLQLLPYWGTHFPALKSPTSKPFKKKKTFLNPPPPPPTLPRKSLTHPGMQISMTHAVCTTQTQSSMSILMKHMLITLILTPIFTILLLVKQVRNL